MKKRIGTIKGKPIVLGDINLLNSDYEIYYKEGGLADLVSYRLLEIIKKANWGGRPITKDDFLFIKKYGLKTGKSDINNYQLPKIYGRALNCYYNEDTPNKVYIVGISENNTICCWAYKKDSEESYIFDNRFQYEIKV